MCTKFYQNRVGIVEDMTKTLGVLFSVHSIFNSTKVVMFYLCTLYVCLFVCLSDSTFKLTHKVFKCASTLSGEIM